MKMTTIRAEGRSQQDGDVRHFSISKEAVIARLTLPLFGGILRAANKTVSTKSEGYALVGA